MLKKSCNIWFLLMMSIFKCNGMGKCSLHLQYYTQLMSPELRLKVLDYVSLNTPAAQCMLEQGIGRITEKEKLYALGKRISSLDTNLMRRLNAICNEHTKATMQRALYLFKNQLEYVKKNDIIAVQDYLAEEIVPLLAHVENHEQRQLLCSTGEHHDELVANRAILDQFKGHVRNRLYHSRKCLTSEGDWWFNMGCIASGALFIPSSIITLMMGTWNAPVGFYFADCFGNVTSYIASESVQADMPCNYSDLPYKLFQSCITNISTMICNREEQQYNDAYSHNVIMAYLPLILVVSTCCGLQVAIQLGRCFYKIFCDTNESDEFIDHTVALYEKHLDEIEKEEIV